MFIYSSILMELSNLAFNVGYVFIGSYSEDVQTAVRKTRYKRKSKSTRRTR